MPSIRTVGWSWQEAHTVIFDSVWEYVTEVTFFSFFCWWWAVFSSDEKLI
ncbi:hypothetical protein [Moorena bouillonii]|nr:hypothetical protein [Moorena bouillonii]